MKKEVLVISPAVPDALELLRNELKDLKVITESSYKTKGPIDGFPNSIAEEKNIENLVKMCASVNGMANAYDNATDTLAKKLNGDFSTPVFKLSGYTKDAIIDDIVLKIRINSISERKAELEALIKEGEQFLTKEDQYKMYLQKIQKATGR